MINAINAIIDSTERLRCPIYTVFGNKYTISFKMRCPDARLLSRTGKRLPAALQLLSPAHQQKLAQHAGLRGGRGDRYEARAGLSDHGLPTMGITGSYAALWRLYEQGSLGRPPLKDVLQSEAKKGTLKPCSRRSRFRRGVKELKRRAVAETARQGRGSPVGEAEVADMLDEERKRADGSLIASGTHLDALISARKTRG